MQYYPLEITDNLHEGYRRTFKLAGHHLLLLVHQEKNYLVDNICPHAGYPMDEGLIINDLLRCPMHGYLFDLENGECKASYEGPCNGINVYDLVEKEDEVGVFLLNEE